MVDSSFYGDTPNYATDYPTQNDSNTNPVAGNTAAPSSFYPNGGIYEELANSDDVLAAAANSAASAAASATGAASSATASAASAAAAAASASTAGTTFLQKANNLSDLTSVATAKANLSLVKADVGLGNVDNTSDVNKPVSTAQASAIALKAPLASPALTGTPTAPTATVGTNTTQIATTAFVLASSSSVSIQDTAPSSPQPGALWWNSATGLLYVYYNDGNSSQWVFAASGAVQNGVLFDGPQTLNSTQKAQARANLGGFGVVKVQKFTASGTYTPSAGMLYCRVEGVGSGGAGGGVVGAVGSSFGGGGGGSGSYSQLIASAATIGVSQTVTIGAAGTGVSAGNGGAGSDCSLGSLLIAKGGGGGLAAGASQVGAGGLGGVAGTGDITAFGACGTTGGWNGSRGTATIISHPGAGGSSHFGGGAGNVASGGNQTAAGVTAGGFGAGGGGAFTDATATSAAGGNGSAGIIIITEYCSQ